jgi:hypothetical protein
MLCDTATKDRFEISEISDVDDLIDAMHECAHQIPGMIQVGTVHAPWGHCASIAIIFSHNVYARFYPTREQCRTSQRALK